MEWVAECAWNRWQNHRGIRTSPESSIRTWNVRSGSSSLVSNATQRTGLHISSLVPPTSLRFGRSRQTQSGLSQSISAPVTVSRRFRQ